MTRKKVKLEFIENESSKKVTYKKRTNGIMKKAQELSVLCGVDVCAIIYGDSDQAPKVWPTSEPEARRIIDEFRRKSEIDQCPRQFDQKTFLCQSVAKAQERLMKLQRKNREIEMQNLICELLAGKPVEYVPICDLGDLIWVIEDRMRSVEHRVSEMNWDISDNNIKSSPLLDYPSLLNTNHDPRGKLKEVIKHSPPYHM